MQKHVKYAIMIVLMTFLVTYWDSHNLNSINHDALPCQLGPMIMASAVIQHRGNLATSNFTAAAVNLNGN